MLYFFFFFQAEDGIRDLVRSRGLGDVYKRQAVVDAHRPVAIINRSHFLNDYSKLYFREIWGKKSCLMHANGQPRLIERDHNVDEPVSYTHLTLPTSDLV